MAYILLLLALFFAYCLGCFIGEEAAEPHDWDGSTILTAIVELVLLCLCAVPVALSLH